MQARCSDCNKFIPWTRSKIVRQYYASPYKGADDVEIGMCEQCESAITDALRIENAMSLYGDSNA